jgi:ATP-dependent Clp protease ATP-binding subunit ClpA
LAPIGNIATQVRASSPTLAIQSILNNGMTSVVSNLGGGGVTNTVSNAANNQLIQQVITANIGITGLSQTIQQNVASTVASRLAAANSQFR